MMMMDGCIDHEGEPSLKPIACVLVELEAWVVCSYAKEDAIVATQQNSELVKLLKDQ